jgi:aldose 1-epimerase
MRTISGQQYVLRANEAEAIIASIGATLRAYTHKGRDVVMPFMADEERPAMRGALLAPWPNRTADARYWFDDELHVLPMNEPERGNASHGLVTDLDFALVDKEDHQLRLTATIEPQPGYPWKVKLDVKFELNGSGLTQTVTATNESCAPAPIGLGWHPYLLAGPAQDNSIDDWFLELPADEVLLVDQERLLPKDTVSVQLDRGYFDFRNPRPIGATVLNNAFTALHRNSKGRTIVRLLCEEGNGAELEFGPECKWVQLYTADMPGLPDHRHALAIEPMTCPPDALNSGQDLWVLPPGQTTAVTWTARAVIA